MRAKPRPVLEVGRPLVRAYAQRDCELTPPLLRSLAFGFQHIEAEVFCMAGRLLVAHDLGQLRAQNTLRKLYLEPLRTHAAAHGGRVFADGTQLWLHVDLKTAAPAGFRALLRLLAEHADLVTDAPPGSGDGRPVRVILSGNRPAPRVVAALPRRWLTLDGRSEDLGVVTDPAVMPVVSDDWTKLFAWRGEGPMPAAERAALASMVARAHGNGQLLRFWGTPDAPGAARELVWSTLLELGVHLLNTHDVPGLSDFLERRRTSRVD